jgi:hypothetical protein
MCQILNPKSQIFFLSAKFKCQIPNPKLFWIWAASIFQFNANIQNTQSVKSFNSIIKKFLNSASILCDVEEAIDKRYKKKLNIAN